MNLNYNFILKLSVGIMMLAMFSCSLIREDLEECDDVDKVYFTLKLKEEEIKEDDISLEEIVDHVILYLFDENGNYFNQVMIENLVLGQEYELDLLDRVIEKGKYDFVAWVNTSYLTYNIVSKLKTRAGFTKEDLMLSLVLSENAVISEDLPYLLYGGLNAKQINVDGNDCIDIPLVRNYNKINFKVTGLEKTDDEYAFYIEDNNGAYDFDNDYLDFQTFRYEKIISFDDSETLNCFLRVLKIGDNRQPKVYFMNKTTGEKLYPRNGEENNLITLIKLAYEGSTIDFDTKHNYNIQLSYQADFSVNIYIDGWLIDESEETLGN